MYFVPKFFFISLSILMNRKFMLIYQEGGTKNIFWNWTLDTLFFFHSLPPSSNIFTFVLPEASRIDVIRNMRQTDHEKNQWDFNDRQLSCQVMRVTILPITILRVCNITVVMYYLYIILGDVHSRIFYISEKKLPEFFSEINISLQTLLFDDPDHLFHHVRIFSFSSKATKRQVQK